MARIFNIYFTYEGIVHNAIVSVRITPFFTEYILGNLDEELRMLLPDNKIYSQTPGHLFFQNAAAFYSEELMNVIIKTIARHLHASNDVGFEA